MCVACAWLPTLALVALVALAFRRHLWLKAWRRRQQPTRHRDPIAKAHRHSHWHIREHNERITVSGYVGAHINNIYIYIYIYIYIFIYLYRYM